VIRTDTYTVHADLGPDQLSIQFQHTDDPGAGSLSGALSTMHAVAYTTTSRPPGDPLGTWRFAFGATRVDIAHVAIIDNGSRHTADTVASAEFPTLRFFIVELPPTESALPTTQTVIGTDNKGQEIYRSP